MLSLPSYSGQIRAHKNCLYNVKCCILVRSDNSLGLCFVKTSYATVILISRPPRTKNKCSCHPAGVCHANTAGEKYIPCHIVVRYCSCSCIMSTLIKQLLKWQFVLSYIENGKYYNSFVYCIAWVVDACCCRWFSWLHLTSCVSLFIAQHAVGVFSGWADRAKIWLLIIWLKWEMGNISLRNLWIITYYWTN